MTNASEVKPDRFALVMITVGFTLMGGLSLVLWVFSTGGIQ